MSRGYDALVSVDRLDELCLRPHSAMLAYEVFILLLCCSLMLDQVRVKEWLKLRVERVEGTAQCGEHGDGGAQNGGPFGITVWLVAVRFERLHLTRQRRSDQWFKLSTKGIILDTKGLEQRKYDSSIVDRALAFGIQLAAARESVPLQASAEVTRRVRIQVSEAHSPISSLDARSPQPFDGYPYQ
jgi:hypothetical protein